MSLTLLRHGDIIQLCQKRRPVVLWATEKQAENSMDSTQTVLITES